MDLSTLLCFQLVIVVIILGNTVVDGNKESQRAADGERREERG